MPAPAIETPCIEICVIDSGSNLCIGCTRTLDEIAAWSQMTPGERRSIITALPNRKRSLAKPTPIRT